MWLCIKFEYRVIGKRRTFQKSFQRIDFANSYRVLQRAKPQLSIHQLMAAGRILCNLRRFYEWHTKESILEFRERHFDWTLQASKDKSPLVIPFFTAASYLRDPRSLLFKLARYKAVGKMLEGKKRVLEIGCGDGFCAPVVKQHVGDLTLIDVDPIFVALAKQFVSHFSGIHVENTLIQNQNNLENLGTFDAVYCLDVLEHIPDKEEDMFIRRVLRCLHERGVFILGIPSIESQKYTTRENTLGHVNVKETKEFILLFEKYFGNVHNFGINDELLHTGYVHLRSYNIFLCTNPKLEYLKEKQTL